MTTKIFLQKAKLIHGEKYNYNKSVFIGDKCKIIIICKQHGEFEQRYDLHLSGKGCYKCGRISSGEKLKYTVYEFIELANKVHNNKYDYSGVDFKSMYENVKIICKFHGEFLQTPHAHTNAGNGCPNCHHFISKPEVKWLDYLQVAQEYRHKTIIYNKRKFNVDALNKSTNTIYEFYGDYWHGNPIKFKSENIHPMLKKTFGELYQKTIDRENELKALGYNVISIWESDWNKIKKPD